MALTYVILDASEVSTIDYSLIKQKNQKELRQNLAKTKVIVKYSGSDTPSFLSGKKLYTHAKILDLMADPDECWNETDVHWSE